MKKINGYQEHEYSIIITLSTNAYRTQVQQAILFLHEKESNFQAQSIILTRDPEKKKRKKDEK